MRLSIEQLSRPANKNAQPIEAMIYGAMIRLILRRLTA